MFLKLFISDLDKKLTDKLSKSKIKEINKILEKKVITIEDGTEVGGLGSTVKELLQQDKLDSVEFYKMSYPDKFITHGEVSKLEKLYNMNDEYIYKKAIDMLKNDKKYSKNFIKRGGKCPKKTKKVI